MTTHTKHLKRFYDLLADLEQHIGGTRLLSQCDGYMDWPQRGVYFFFESGELRKDTGSGPRVVRVGTHALKSGSSTKLWGRLAQHKGQAKSGGGNHRGSIFRLLIGTALIEHNSLDYPTWGEGNTASRDIRQGEHTIEQAVSRIIGAMPFLWLAIDDEPEPSSLRGYIERNSIALLSNYNKPPLDAPSKHWLGHYCDRVRVKMSGLWNQRHVDEQYEPEFLGTLEQIIHNTRTTQ